MEPKTSGTRRCAACACEITIGRDAIRVQEGVIGTRGFVELGDAAMFCSEDCLGEHFDGSDTIKLDRRIA